MLKYRLLTAVIGLPIFILAVWFLPAIGLALLTALIIAVAAWEWSQFLDFERFASRCIYTAVVVAAIGLAFFIPIIYWFIAAFLIQLWSIAALLSYAKKGRLLGFSYSTVKAVTGVLLLVAFWLAINVLRSTLSGPLLLLVGFVLVWAVDVGAYFAGRALGKHYLAPSISPKKTWEGLIGGFILSLMVGAIFAWVQSMPWREGLLFCVLVLLVAVFSVIGDLFESLLKRQVDIKDSGRIFPGHGGMLDRFDSAIAALPIFALGLLFI